MVDQIEGQRGTFYSFGDHNKTGPREYCLSSIYSVQLLRTGPLNIHEEIQRHLTGWVRCITPRL